MTDNFFLKRVNKLYIIHSNSLYFTTNIGELILQNFMYQSPIIVDCSGKQYIKFQKWIKISGAVCNEFTFSVNKFNRCVFIWSFVHDYTECGTHYTQHQIFLLLKILTCTSYLTCQFWKKLSFGWYIINTHLKNIEKNNKFNTKHTKTRRHISL